MIRNNIINFKNKTCLYFSLFILASFFCLQTDAQRNAERREGNSPRSFSPGPGRLPRVQPSSPARQTPSSNNRWSNNDHQNRDFRRQQPTQFQRPPQANNNNDERFRRQNNSPFNNRNNNNNSRFDNHRNYPIASRHDNFRYGSNYRRPVYNPHNPGWRYSYLPRRNSFITSFSFPYQTISYGGFGYRYCDGVFYRPYNNIFRVVAPPFGLFINILPFGYNRIVVNDYPYYYYNGTYYDEYESSYRVVAPPVGALVESIPEGYETIVIDGETYYKVDDVQYKPAVQDNGEIWYEVIKVGT